MNRSVVRALCVGGAVAVLALGITSTSNALTMTAKSTPTCSARHLALGPGPQMSMMTGEVAQYYSITNTGKTSCSLKGFPTLTVYTPKGAVIPFKYAHSSSYLHALTPKIVVLKPHGAGYVWVGKYRCDLGIKTVGTKMRVTLPGLHAGSLVAPVAQGGRVTSWDYCKGGPKDNGNTMAISPITATPQD